MSSGLGTTTSALPALSDSKMLPLPAWLTTSDAAATCAAREGVKSKYLWWGGSGAACRAG